VQKKSESSLEIGEASGREGKIPPTACAQRECKTTLSRRRRKVRGERKFTTGKAARKQRSPDARQPTTSFQKTSSRRTLDQGRSANGIHVKTGLPLAEKPLSRTRMRIELSPEQISRRLPMKNKKDKRANLPRTANLISSEKTTTKKKLSTRSSENPGRWGGGSDKHHRCGRVAAVPQRNSVSIRRYGFFPPWSCKKKTEVNEEKSKSMGERSSRKSGGKSGS